MLSLSAAVRVFVCLEPTDNIPKSLGTEGSNPSNVALGCGAIKWIIEPISTSVSICGFRVLLAQEYGQYPGITSTWLLFFARCLWRLDPTFFHALIGDFEDFVAGYDGREILQNLRCPILFIHGEVELDGVLSAEEEAWLRENCQNMQLAAISGVGHHQTL